MVNVAPPVRIITYIHRSTMGGDDGAGDCQANADSVALGRDERLEGLLRDRRRQTAAGVFTVRR